MKVLHLISSGGMYGAESVILNLSHALNAGPHQSLIGSFANASNPNLQLHERATAEGIESYLVPCHGQMDRAAIAKVRELAARVGADVVHAHGYKADLYVHFALNGRVPLVSTCHNWLDDDLKVRVYGVADRFVLRRYGRVVAVSDAVRDRLLKAGVPQEKVRQIRNGINLRPYADALPSLRTEFGAAPIVGVIARLSQEKGVDVFLRAVPLVLDEVPEARFVVVGGGPDSEKLTALIAELGIGANVSMLGRRDDIPSVYASLDVMVSPSRLEGLPMAILEGMASACALVATAVGAVPTVVEDNRTGVLVPAENERTLAEAMVGLLCDPARRQRLGAAARRLMEEEFSAERMAEDYLRVYREAIDARGAKR